MNAQKPPNIGNVRQIPGQGLIAHLMVITHFVQKSTMDKLLSKQHYTKLSLAYVGYISLLAQKDYSPGELAAKLEISKQACSKTLKELENLGLIGRRKNPEDSRSSLLSLTEKGKALLQDGSRATAEIHQHFADSVGSKQMQRLCNTLEKLCRAWELDIDASAFQVLKEQPGEIEEKPVRINLFLIRLNDYLRHALFTALSQQGFHGLKPSQGQVLGLLNREERRVQYIASVIGVSKQAVAAMAADLEESAYITRKPDPDDKRHVILSLSPLGKKLLSSAEAHVRKLEASIKEVLSDEEYTRLDETMAALYFVVAEHFDTASVLPAKIQQLSEFVLSELGVSGARTLAQHLMTITRGDS